MTKKQNNKFAKTIINAAERALRDGLLIWGPEGSEPARGMASMIRGDYEDMRKVAKFLREGKLAHAENKMYAMDSVARDKIPNSAYEYIQRNN